MKENMKALMRKISYSLAIAVAELALGVLLLVSPGGFTAVLFTVVATVLIAAGVLSIVNYFRLPKEDSAKTWKLSAGAASICAGVLALTNSAWLVETFGVLTTVYGAIVLAFTFLKLQMAVDALRGGRRFWYLMAISVLLSVIMAALLILNPFGGESAVWLFMGVALIVTATLDGVYFLLGRQERQAQQKA